MRSRSAALLLTLLLAASALAGSSAPSCTPSLPADLLALLPASPDAVAVFASFMELELEWDRLKAVLPQDPGAEPLPDLRAALGEEMPGLFSLLDVGRPAALAYDLAPAMSQQPPQTVLILPLLRPVTDAELAAFTNVRRWHRSGEYIGLSGSLGYAPTPWPQETAARLLPGAAACFVDLAGMIRDNRGMIEMGLGGLTMQMTVPQPGQDGPPPMTPAEAQALIGALRTLFDSLDRFDAAWAGDADALVLRSRLGVTAGSPFAEDGQPSFAGALSLADRLPGDADLFLVSAWDQQAVQEVMQPLQRLNMLSSLEDLAPAQREAALAWFDGMAEVERLSYAGMAMTLRMAEGRLSIVTAVRCDEPTLYVDRLTALFDAPPEFLTGVGVKTLPDESVAGHAVSVWKLDFDGFAGLLAGAGAAPEAQEAARNLFTLVPHEFRLCVDGDVIYMTADEDGTALDALLQGPRAGLARRAAGLAEIAGPHCRLVYGGDLRLVGGILAAALPAAAFLVSAEPAPFAGHLLIDGDDTTSELRLGRAGLAALMRTVAALESLESAQD